MTLVIGTVVIATVVIVTVIIVTLLIVTVVIVTVVIVTIVIITVVIMTVVKVTYFSKIILTHGQPVRCSQGRVLRFLRCFSLTPRGLRTLMDLKGKTQHFLKLLLCMYLRRINS